MKLELIYDAADKIPDGMAALYTEKDGKFYFSAIEGLKTEGDVTRLQEALRKERADHADLKTQTGDLSKKLSEMTDNYGRVAGSLRQTKVEHAIDRAARDANVISGAIPDVQGAAAKVFQLNETGEVVTSEGETPEQWIQNMKETRGHWWPNSVSAGSQGGRGGGGVGESNPFTAKHWSPTQQGQVVKKQGMDHAKKFARAAGSRIGATTPPGH